MKTLTGQFMFADGNPIAGGILLFELSQDACTSAETQQVAPALRSYTLDEDGAFTATLYGNDELLPTNTYYTVSVKTGGQLVYGPELFVIAGGSSINFNSLVPTPRNSIPAVVLQPTETESTTYRLSDVDNSTYPAYFGYLGSTGKWYVKQYDGSAMRYAQGSSDYSTNWSNRSLLTYNHYDQVF